MKQHHSSTWRLPRSLRFFLLLSSALFAFNAGAQNKDNNKPIFVSMTYLKTAPGKYNDYLDLVRTYTKKYQQYNLQQGKQMGWYLYEVLMPTGSEAAYNFVGVNVSADLQQLIDPLVSPRDIMQKASPDLTAHQIDSLTALLVSARTIVKREVYLHRSGTNEDSPPAKYAEIDFMTPVQGKEADYAKMEMDKFLPVHKQRMALGALKGWRFAEKVMPASTSDPYPFITANFYDSFDGMLDGKYAEAVKKAWPTLDAAKLFACIDTVKKGQKNELWKLVEYADKFNTK